MSAAREKATTPATGQTETRFWLQLLSLHGELFAALNAAMIAELGLSLAKFDALAQLADLMLQGCHLRPRRGLLLGVLLLDQ